MKPTVKRFLARLGAHLVQPNLPSVASADDRTSPAAKTAMIAMTLDLQSKARQGQRLPRLADSGLRVFSQFEEDGYLLYLAAVLELEPKLFLDIGAGDGIKSNCANLALNLGWHGLFIDADAAAIDRGRAFYASHPDTTLWPPTFIDAPVTVENINDLIRGAGFEGDIGICSIDIDGNDCWIWNALEAVSPAVVIIETHIEFGMRNIAVPYDPAYRYPGRHPEYFGASAVAMNALATKKGYRLVGANRFGFNMIFARHDLYPDRVPSVTLESVLHHPRYQQRLSLFEAIKDWDYSSL